MLSRRELLVQSGALAGAGVLVATSAPMAMAATPAAAIPKFPISLNTATIRGFKLPLPDQVDLAAKAGYDGIEPWTSDIRAYAESGGSLSDMRKRIADAGLEVVSAIAFPAWASDDDTKRAEALEQMKQEMDLLRQIGGCRIAAPPAGINRGPAVDLRKVAERYRAALELGRQTGVLPQLEIWGSATTLGRVSEAAFVAIEAGHPDACLLLDAYHIYKGGSSFDSLRLLNGAAMHVFHINDYPAEPPRETITDGDRIYPGDGVAPLVDLVET
ncbi:MAG: sugar phosphate isomerase/epimerase family protein, partial [Planctomycetota bacterium]